MIYALYSLFITIIISLIVTIILIFFKNASDMAIVMTSIFCTVWFLIFIILCGS